MKRWAALALLAAGCATPQPLASLAAGQTGAIAYRSLLEDLTLSGFLRLPERPAGRVPAVVIVHGTGGIDGRGAKWAAFFLEQGIGSLEIDYFGPRGLSGTERRLPSPTFDVHSAVKLLATHPRVDARRIAVLGFSRGGGMSLASSNAAELVTGVRTAAHVALYPWCAGPILVDAADRPPVLILSGANDHDMINRACEAAAKVAAARGRDVRFKAYEGAYHGWDGSFGRQRWVSPEGTELLIQGDAAVTRQSMQDVLMFLRGPLHLP